MSLISLFPIGGYRCFMQDCKGGHLSKYEVCEASPRRKPRIFRKDGLWQMELPPFRLDVLGSLDQCFRASDWCAKQNNPFLKLAQPPPQL